MTIPQKPIHPETMEQTFQRWLSDGTTWIAIFENHDLAHLDLGRRIAFPYDVAQEEGATIGVTRSPDHASIGVGWRYLLVARAHTVHEAVNAMKEDKTRG